MAAEVPEVHEKQVSMKRQSSPTDSYRFATLFRENGICGTALSFLWYRSEFSFYYCVEEVLAAVFEEVKDKAETLYPHVVRVRDI